MKKATKIKYIFELINMGFTPDEAQDFVEVQPLGAKDFIKREILYQKKFKKSGIVVNRHY